MNYFGVPDGDQSVKYLFNMFGSMNGIIPSNVSGVSITILGTMFKTFNTAVLIVGILIIVYTTIVGVMKTAHEGEFMGKKWNNIWIPIRSVLGIIALFPTASGFSALQMLMMWVVINGVGAADQLWGTTLNYLDKVGSRAGITIPSTSAYQAFQMLFQSFVCDATAKEARVNPTIVPPETVGRFNYFCYINTTDNWCKTSAIPNIKPDDTIANPIIRDDKGKSIGRRALFGPGGACGELIYCDATTACSGPDSSPLKCKACQTQQTQYKILIPYLYSIAQSFTNADYSYREFYYHSFYKNQNPDWQWIYDYCARQSPPIPQEKCCIRSKNVTIEQSCQASEDVGNFLFPPDQNNNPQNASTNAVAKIYLPFMQEKAGIGKSNFINTFTNEYISGIGAAVNNYILNPTTRTTMSSDLQEAYNAGWMLAGSYYYTIANRSKNNLEDSMPSILVKSPTNPLPDYRNNFSAAGALASEMAAGAIPGLAALPTLPGVGMAAGAISVSLSDVRLLAANVVSSKVDNALMPLWATGNTLLAIAERLFLLLITITLSVGLAGNISVWFLGSGFVNPVGPAATLVFFLVAPALFGILAIMVSLGGTLGVYIPLIPYVIFTMGAVGWMISIVETMVAGPLVALGIISPSGQHEVMGKAEPALMLLFNMFLRPSLMIFGMIAAMFLSSAAVNLVNLSFGTVFSSIPPFSIIGLILWLSAYVTLILAVLNKCFQTIYLIPQQVMRWIGGRGEEYGEAHEGVSAMKGGLDAARGKASGAAGGGMGQAEHGAGKGMQRQKYKDSQGDQSISTAPGEQAEGQNKPKGGTSGGSGGTPKGGGS